MLQAPGPDCLELQPVTTLITAEGTPPSGRDAGLHIFDTFQKTKTVPPGERGCRHKRYASVMRRFYFLAV